MEKTTFKSILREQEVQKQTNSCSTSIGLLVNFMTYIKKENFSICIKPEIYIFLICDTKQTNHLIYEEPDVCFCVIFASFFCDFCIIFSFKSD